MATRSYLKNAPLKDKMPGTWDVGVFQEGEADLYKHHTSCQKNPDHKEFIPVDTFDITHLPTDYQHNDIVEYIKLVAQLTVRITVKYVSPHRPATIPGTDTPYPFYENRGENIMRVGTGMITSYHPRLGLHILTATHLVFDSKEVTHTSCRLFYDNDDKPSHRDAAIELSGPGFSACNGNTITDKNVLSVRVYEENLEQEIVSILVKLYQIRKIIKKRFLQNSYGRDNKPLTLIVSHPHGCSKKISIGRCVEVDDNLDDVRFLYTTPTCPGSSGAAVICLDKLDFYFNSVHSGTWNQDASLNLGSCRYETSYSLRQVWDLDWMLGHPDVRIPDLCCHSLFLQAHPLPPGLNHNLLIDFIHTFPLLCSNIYVEYVSQLRPKFWPGSKLKYPFYNERGCKMERLGRGWVDRVDIYPNQSCPDKICDCDECRNSLTPERKFAQVRIMTSSSLVFDQTEGQFVRLCLYCSQYSIFNKNLLVCSNIETDRSELVFLAHDLVIAEELKSLLEHVSFLKEKIQDNIFKDLLANPISIIIRSHWEYSIGRCVRVGKHLVYTNEAEEDDVGAPVIVLGNKHLDVDVCGHTGQYPHDPTLGYSRYLNYRYK